MQSADVLAISDHIYPVWQLRSRWKSMISSAY